MLPAALGVKSAITHSRSHHHRPGRNARMLRGIHKASSNWLGKAVLSVIMGLLVVSFAVWGVGDIFRGVGLDRQLLGQLVAETALDEQSRKLRLGLADADIAQRITGDPTFRGPNGQFDRARFEQTIRQAGYSESRFVEEQRRITLRRQIAQSISGGLNVPVTAQAAIYQFQNEKRSIEYLPLGAAQAGDIPVPTPEVLAKYFDERKVLFRAPEYRKITLLSLSPADIAKPDAVSDADAKSYYEQHKASYGTP